jgi:hypothetical protein
MSADAPFPGAKPKAAAAAGAPIASAIPTVSSSILCCRRNSVADAYICVAILSISVGEHADAAIAGESKSINPAALLVAIIASADEKTILPPASENIFPTGLATKQSSSFEEERQHLNSASFRRDPAVFIISWRPQARHGECLPARCH